MIFVLCEHFIAYAAFSVIRERAEASLKVITVKMTAQ